MNIISASLSSYSLPLYLRSQDVEKVVLERSGQLTSFTGSIVSVTHSTGSYSTLNFSVPSSSFSEGNSYSITVKDSLDQDIYRGLLFATSQNPSTYSINSGSYTSFDSTQDYIRLD